MKDKGQEDREHFVLVTGGKVRLSLDHLPPQEQQKFFSTEEGFLGFRAYCARMDELGISPADGLELEKRELEKGSTTA